ncbi:hypothetical protein HZA44_02775 [Candidatus Peregrinibacteria bacterium]|nr:hypothetical protein [Candidatus Peregrinibacteria bacterium]
MPESKQSIHVLVVESESKGTGDTKATLQDLGLSPDAIITAQSIEQAMDILAERAVKGERERIALLLCDTRVQTEGDGVALMQLVKNDFENPPYVIATGGADEGVATHEIADAFLAHEPRDLYGARMKEELTRAKGMLPAQAFDEVFRESVQANNTVAQTQELASARTDAKESERAPTWFELDKEHKIEDLREQKHDKEGQPVNRLVAVFDLDGTLAKPFTMGRFVQFLTESSEKGQESILRQLLKEVRKGADNVRASKDLVGAFKRFRDNPAGYKGEFSDKVGYVAFIIDTNKYFSEMLNGLSAQSVFKLGEEWCRKDAPRQIFSHARPIIRLCKELDIVPTLVTGTPAEAVAGFRQVLEIEERCHPLELATDETGRYSGLKYETGLTKSKNEVIRKIVRNGNHIILSAGDQVTDSPLHEAALSREHDSLSGIACYFGSDQNDIQGFSHHLENRWMLPIPYMERTTFAILEMIVERLHAVSQLEENMAVLSVGFREKINDLINDRKTIRKFLDLEAK